ncbi:urease accessory protein D-like isoform X2 [Anneissia japonica]|nr:urease accessory protein D-like isoform X2 [Anneissia japonica]XP_033119631.1 urease accessory protein D-like isoform X2 [Anneissia japonica]
MIMDSNKKECDAKISNQAKAFFKLMPKSQNAVLDKQGNKQAVAVDFEYTYPLKLMIPKFASTNNCVWVYFISFGGGLVEGDKLQFSVEIGTECCSVITTQSSTKVFACSGGLLTEQHLVARICPGGLLAFLPDFIVCFEDAAYKQTQVFHMSHDSSLIVLDWCTSGRMANNEIWDFTSFRSSNSIFIDNKLVFKDCMLLDQHKIVPLKEAMHHYNVLATCIIIGKSTEEQCQHLLQVLGKRQALGELINADVSLAISELKYTVEGVKIPGVVIKFATSNTLQAIKQIEEILQHFYNRLGGNPFEGKY